MAAMNDMMDTSLDSVPFGIACRVTGFDEHAVEADAESGATALRLIELGFGEGARVVKRHAAPVTLDPLAIEIGGHMVAMRRADARLVLVSEEQA